MSALEILELISQHSSLIVVTIVFIVAAMVSWGLFPRTASEISDNQSRIPVAYLIPLLFVVLIGLIAVVLLAYLDMFSKSKFSTDPAAWGQAGDYFGGMLNPIFAFASFIALLYTIQIQSKQIRDTREGQQLAAFESAFFPLIAALRDTPRPTRERIGSMNRFNHTYEGQISPERRSQDYVNFYSGNEPSIIGFSTMFYECVQFLEEHNSAMPVHWTVLASVLTPAECYFIASLSCSIETNSLGIARFTTIATKHRLFRRAKRSGTSYVSIGHGDSLCDGGWSLIRPEDFGLSINAFTSQVIQTE